MVIGGAGRRLARRARRARNATRAVVNSSLAKGAVQPGGTGYSMNNAAPQMSEASSAWFNTLFNPAHGREYHCVGLPDENQNPTNVCSVNLEFMVSTATFSDICARSLSAIGEQADGSYMWLDTVGLLGLTSDPVSITFMTCANVDPVIVWEGNLEYGTTQKKVNLVRAIFLLDLQSKFPQGIGGRALSSSVTVSNITRWSDTGGYFLGGTAPCSGYHDTNGIQCPTIPIDYENYRTYTGESAAGGYAISRPRSIDGISRFTSKTLTNCAVTKGVGTFVVKADSTTTGGTTAQMSAYPAPFPSWDWSYVTYLPCAQANGSHWALRVTYWYNVEVTRPYHLGGIDGAPYDRFALNAAMSFCDHMAYVFPAEANDGETLRTMVRQVAKTAAFAIARAMGFPADAAESVYEAIVQLISGLRARNLARKQLPRRGTILLPNA